MIKLPEKGICAHRGEIETYPESTIVAFKKAVSMGAQMIEFDVRKSKDGHFFISHEFTLERINGRNISPTELTWTELQKLDVGSHKGDRFKNERIPALEEILRIMPVNIWLLVHLWSGDLKMAQEVSRIISCNRQHQVILGTTPDRIKAAREVCPGIKTMHWSNNCPNSFEYVNESIELKVDFLRFWSMQWAKKPMTQKLINKAKDAGIRILYCEALNPEEIVQLLEMGIDFPIADCALSEAMNACKKLKYFPVKPIFPEDVKR